MLRNDCSKTCGGPGASEQNLFREYEPLVHQIAWSILRRLPPSIALDDLLQSGRIALWQAAQSYDPEKGAGFKTYAGLRIRGAILDYLRRDSWLPRSRAGALQQVRRARAKTENLLLRKARDSEAAAALGLSVADYHQLLRDSENRFVVPLDDLNENEAPTYPCPSEKMEALVDTCLIEHAISELPDEARVVIQGVYRDGLTLREVGEKFLVSESRIFQICKEAVCRIRQHMAESSGRPLA